MEKLIRAQFKEEDTVKVNEEKDFSDKIDGILDLIEKETGFRPDMNDLPDYIIYKNELGPEEAKDWIFEALISFIKK